MTAVQSTKTTIARNRGAELIFTQQAWESALRPLLIEPRGLYAVGGFRRGSDRRGIRELRVDRLEVTRERPQGLTRPPLDDWVVLFVNHTGRSMQPESLIRQLQPRQSQDLAVLILEGADRRRWSGAYFKTGTILPLEGVRVIGPGMLRLWSKELPAAPDSPAMQQRWTRTVGALGAALHRKIRQSTVTLIGAGRNGLQMAFSLAALGVAHLRLIDTDRLGIENLDAMPGLSLRDVGRPKVQCLGRRLLKFRPDLSVSCIPRPVTDVAVVELLRQQRCDLLVSCVDSDTPRMAAALLARETLTVHLDAGTSVQADEQGEREIIGDVRLLVPAEGCVACVGGLDLDETLYELAAPPGCLRRGIEQPWHGQRAGSLVTINAITVNVAVQAWLDLLAGRVRTSMWHRLRWDPGTGLEVHAGPVGGAEECGYCHPE